MAELTSAEDPNALIKYTAQQTVSSGTITAIPYGTQVTVSPGIVEAGARHSVADMADMQEIHDRSVKQGATCNPLPAAESTDRWPASAAVLQEVESVLSAEEHVQLRESSFAALTESLDPTSNTLTVRIIRPGFNSSKTRYYTPEAVKSIAKGMSGVKMYIDHPTEEDDHNRPERSLKDWAATIIETWVDPQSHDAMGKVKVHNKSFLDSVQSLSTQGLLNHLGTSIRALGTGKRGMMEGQDTLVVEGIDGSDPFRSVDFVTEPGAGGQALLLESITKENKVMAEDVETQKLNEAFPPAHGGVPAPVAPHPAAPVAAAPAPVAPAAPMADPQDMQRDQRLAALEAAIAHLTSMMQELAQAAGMDNLLSQSGASEATKRIARERLIASGQPVTKELVNETVTKIVKEAREILGDNSTGVKNFGMSLRENDNLNDGDDDEEITDDMLAEVTKVNPAIVKLAFPA